MNVAIVTEPTLEPVTLAEMKEYLRYDGGTFGDQIESTQSIAPGSHAIVADYGLEGDGVDVFGYQALVVLESGTNGVGGTVDAKIQESDDDTTYTDWTGGAFTQVTETGAGATEPDNATYEIEYTGTKQYIRVVATVAGAACEFGVSIIDNSPTAVEDDLITDLITTAREQVEDYLRRKLITQTWDYYLDDFPDEGYYKLPYGNLQSVTHITYTNSSGTETNLTKAITAFADSDVSSGVKTKVTSAAHGFSSGDTVMITGTTSYDGTWEISNVTVNTFDITVVFVANDATGMATTDYIVETNGAGCGRIVLPYGDTWPSFTAYPSNAVVTRFVCGYGDAAADVPLRAKIAIMRLVAKMFESRGEDVIGQSVYEDKTIQSLLYPIRLWDEIL